MRVNRAAVGIPGQRPIKPFQAFAFARAVSRPIRQAIEATNSSSEA
jgi:hypothetical protein